MYALFRAGILNPESLYPMGGRAVHAWEGWVSLKKSNTIFMCMFIFLKKVLRAFYQFFKVIHDHKKA